MAGRLRLSCAAMNTVGIILGQQATQYNNIKDDDVFVRFNDSPGVTQVSMATGQQIFAAPSPAHVACVFDTLRKPSKDPALLIIFANAREMYDPWTKLATGPHTHTGRHERQAKQPVGLRGRSHDIASLLTNAAAAAHQRGGPLDVFLLTARDPEIVHRHVGGFPRGSVLAGVKTAALLDKQQHPLMDALMSDELRLHQPLHARNLLLTAMMCGEQLAGRPALAVSGLPRRHLHEVWNSMGRSGLDASTRREIKALQMLLPAAHRHAIDEGLQQANGGSTQARQASPAALACALLNEWENIYPGSRTQRTFEFLSPGAITQHTTLQSNGQSYNAHAPAPTSSTGTKTRLNTGELSQLPPKLRKIAQHSPHLVRRLVRG